jgi:hypothetical protein
MSACPSCKRAVTAAGDHCEHCGAYLRWTVTGEVRTPTQSRTATARPQPTPTQEQPKPTSPMQLQRIRVRDVRGAQTPAPVVEKAGEVRLSLHAVDGSAGAGLLRPRVVPGESVELLARIHNRTDRVDRFTVSVSGLPDDWWTIDAPAVSLNPYGAQGRSEGEVCVRFHPPRSPRAEAGQWSLTVSVVSDNSGTEAASAPVVLEIAPYDELRAELRPPRRLGYRRGRFTVAVTNAANAPADVALACRDEEDACQLRLDRPQLTIGPGETAATRLTLRPPGRHWIGRPLEHRFRVTYSPPTAVAEPAGLEGTFRRRAWFPWWSPLAAGVAAAAVIALVMLTPDKTRVPDLRGVKSPFAAQKLLRAAGLKLAPSPKPELTPNAIPGQIVDQDPGPGTELEQGSAVTVVLAARSNVHTVPSVVGLTPADADRKLRALGLSLGSVQPQPADLEAKIVGQLPPPDVKVKAGTSVNVTLAVDTPPGPVVSPEPAPSPSPTPTPTPAPSGLLAFDDGSKLLSWSTAGLKPLLPDGQTGTEPTWSADGKTVAFMRLTVGRGEIMQVAVGGTPAAPHAITDGQGDYHRPAFSPAGGIIAYIDERHAGGGRLCLQPADGAQHAPSCLRASGWSFQRQPTWSPDGRQIVVIGRKAGQTGLFGFRLRGGAPSVDADAWKPISSRLLVALKGVNAVAWSPDGKTIAAIADGRGTGKQLTLVPLSADGALGRPRRLPTKGCEVTWSSLGWLAVSQYECGSASAAAGQIVVVDPASPAIAAPVPGVLGANPVWQPQQAGG